LQASVIRRGERVPFGSGEEFASPLSDIRRDEHYSEKGDEDILHIAMSIETLESDSLAFGGYVISAGFCVVLGLLGAWGSPSWFSAFPLRYAYRFMDAIGAYALSCSTYFSVRYFTLWRRGSGAFPSWGLLFALCFFPVALYSAMVIFDLALDSIDLLRKVDVFLCWSASAAAALPSASRGRGFAENRVTLTIARGTLATWCLIALVFLAGQFSDVPGIVPASFYALLFLGITVVAFQQSQHGPAPKTAGVAMPESLCSSLKLSGREREVVGLLLEGKTNQEIADALFISLSTVKSHLASVFEKTGARNRVEVSRLFSPGDPPKG